MKSANQIVDLFSLPLKNFTYLRAAIACIRSVQHKVHLPQDLYFEDLPTVFEAARPESPASTAIVLTRIADLTSGNGLRKLVFLELVANLEAYMSERLTDCGKQAEGTFGKLQGLCMAEFQVSSDTGYLVDELRERRNCLIHHDGKATKKYVAAAQRASSVESSLVVASVGASLELSDKILFWYGSVCVRYSIEISRR